MHEAFYGKYFTYAQTVCTRSLLGGEGPGDEANLHPCQELFLQKHLETRVLVINVTVSSSTVDPL